MSVLKFLVKTLPLIENNIFEKGEGIKRMVLVPTAGGGIIITIMTTQVRTVQITSHNIEKSAMVELGNEPFGSFHNIKGKFAFRPIGGAA